MQSGVGMAQPPMADHQQQQPQPQQQHWGMMQPQYQQQQPPQPTWNQQPSQVPPPQHPVQASVPMQQQQQQQYQMQLQQQQQQYQAQAQQQQQYQAQAQQQQYQVQAQQQQQQPASADEIRTLWIGDLQYWMEESYLHTCFASAGEVVSVKVIRNKQTGQSEGYGFIEFASRAAADRVIQTFNAQLMPSTEQKFRVNWATLGAGERRNDSADFPIFVGDLSADVTDYVLEETFRAHYTSVKGAKVVIDRATGRSKGYGFVRFSDATEQTRAMSEMNGVFCSSRPMRTGPATSKKTMGDQQQYPPKASYQSSQAAHFENDPNNTTIFVGALDSSVSDEQLRQLFGQYGELVHVKIPVGKRCGFVQFANRACAEEALLMLNGAQLGGQNIRLSWGRSLNKQETSAGGWSQPQPDPNQWNGGGYYGYGQGYQSYGYAAPPQDPNAYTYGSYPAYGNYQQQAQQ